MKFEVGEIVIFAWTDNPMDTQFIGLDCEILEITDNYIKGFKIYKIDIPNCPYNEYYASAKCLKKKPKNLDEVIWADIEAEFGWNPTKEKVDA